MVVGIVATRTEEYHWAIFLGWSLTVISSGIFILLGLHATVAEWVFLMLLSGIGIGVLFPAHSLAVQTSVPQKHIAIAIVMSSFSPDRWTLDRLLVSQWEALLSQKWHATIAFAYCDICTTLHLTTSRDIYLPKSIPQRGRGLPYLASNATRYSLDAGALVEIIKSLPQNSIESRDDPSEDGICQCAENGVGSNVWAFGSCSLG